MLEKVKGISIRGLGESSPDLSATLLDRSGQPISLTEECKN